MHPGGAEKGRCGGGGGAGAGRGGLVLPAPSSRPAHPALLYSPGRRRRRWLLTLCPLPGAALPSRVGSSTTGRPQSLPRGGLCIPSSHCWGAPARVRPFFGVFARAATKQRAPNFATLRVALAQREPARSAAQLRTPCSWRRSWSPAWRAVSGGELWRSGGEQWRLLPRLPLQRAEEDPWSRSRPQALDDWQEERSPHLVSSLPAASLGVVTETLRG